MVDVYLWKMIKKYFFKSIVVFLLFFPILKIVVNNPKKNNGSLIFFYAMFLFVAYIESIIFRKYLNFLGKGFIRRIVEGFIYGSSILVLYMLTYKLGLRYQ